MTVNVAHGLDLGRLLRQGVVAVFTLGWQNRNDCIHPLQLCQRPMGAVVAFLSTRLAATLLALNPGALIASQSVGGRRFGRIG
jgi:hypothetical protein